MIGAIVLGLTSIGLPLLSRKKHGIRGDRGTRRLREMNSLYRSICLSSGTVNWTSRALYPMPLSLSAHRRTSLVVSLPLSPNRTASFSVQPSYPFGIVENLPGVGENLQGHVLVSGVVFKYGGKLTLAIWPKPVSQTVFGV